MGILDLVDAFSDAGDPDAFGTVYNYMTEQSPFYHHTWKA